jgi:hypothetical protein
MTVNAAGSNGLTRLPKNGGIRVNTFFVSLPKTNLCKRCLTSERADHWTIEVPHYYETVKLKIPLIDNPIHWKILLIIDLVLIDQQSWEREVSI